MIKTFIWKYVERGKIARQRSCDIRFITDIGRTVAGDDCCLGIAIKCSTHHYLLVGLVSLFNGISTFLGYLMPKPFSKKNSSGTI